ncbi:MAG TPA: CapA family protein [Vicinamibacterales bacterium]|nr:CapA family protein [Vicinamibacterales bacterium]
MDEASITLFLAGDVMTGRGIDQILTRPSAPELHEPYVTDAREYVRLAEQISGPVPRGVGSDYIWGDALAEWARMAPAARLVNLETSITHSGEHEPKSINYRMHPDNVGCLRAARLDICILANNHVLDYGPAGLIETLETLRKADVRAVGAGRNRDEAMNPVVHALPGGQHLIVGACAHESSGVPDHWAALTGVPGVNLLPDLSDETAADVAARVARHKLPGDVAVLSIHWGGNWGYDVPRQHINFAHRLVEGGIDIVYGHSSHHVRPIEIYRDRLILYGCGDFIDDYEGITGYERYRDDLVLMFFPSVSQQTGRLLMLEMTPLQIRHMRLNRASLADGRWICDTVNEISRPFGAHVALTEHGALRLSQKHA